ncbi:MAG: DNA repair protein RadA [Cyclobacteriaceae bacterium]|nr:DNA repair protein RadA [Cyclobacteriaceae bacterium HetDA_MAG_MS6]
MAKTKTAFFCQNCGAQSAKWVGKCPSCGEWNTYVEELLQKEDNSNASLWQKESLGNRSRNQPREIQDITVEKLDRFSSGDGELDRVLGGGIVNGSLVLIGGDPGIGKSTLLLQVAIRLSLKILYVSGEESPQQIKMRADRLGIINEKCFLLSETSLEDVFNQVAQLNPDMVVIDSIQTLHSSRLDATAGSISQVRECTGQLMRFAKETNTPAFLIGHINKEGNIAGPKVLEHMVDTVLQFEGDRNMVYRILRNTKNRFGSTDELGIYRMHDSGLEEVKNPSEILISDHDTRLSGVAIGALMEGNRPLLIEVQALVSPATYGTPQRTCTGFDVKRLHMLLAVLEKRLGVRLSTQDVFLNITGGLRVDDPSLDLAVCAAVFSSYNDITLPEKTCFVAEVGLGGEMRSVNRIETRMLEAAKLGFSEIYISSNGGGKVKSIKDSQVHAFPALRDALQDLFG